MTRIEGTKNGWRILPDTDNDKWNAACEEHHPVKCVICNANTAKRFRVRLLGSNIITVNNKLADDIVYFNRIC